MMEVEGISKEWDDFQLKNVSFDVERGEYFVLLGPTGAGKTLLLELLAGFYEPDEGRVMVDDEDYTFKEPHKRDFAFVYQDYMLFPHMDVRENIAYGLEVRDADGIQEKVLSIAREIGVEDLLKRKPRTLSGGEQQRVSLARALIMEPEILLLDEPFGSLDYKTTEELRELVKDIHKDYGCTVIHVTHDQEEAVLMGDRLGVMKDGAIVQIGEPQGIMRRPTSKFVAEFVGTGNIFHGKAGRDGDVTIIDVDGVEIYSTAKARGDVTATIRPEDIIVSEEGFESSARNNFKGVVRRITDRGIYQEVEIDIGVPMIVFITRQSVEGLGLEEGKDIYLLFKASAVHLFNE